MSTYAPALLLVLGGCARSVIPLYEAARAEALADPGPAPANWQADAWLQISSPTLDNLLVALLRENAVLSSTFDAGFVQVTPELTISNLTLNAANGCDDCLTVDLDLTGTVGWTSALGSGSTGLTASGKFDAVFDATQEGGDWQVTARPRKLRNIGVSLAGGKIAVPTGAISDWITGNLLTDIPPLTLAELSGAELPIRALRVVPVQKAVRVEVLTRVPNPVPAPAAPALTEGWAVGISEASLLAVARAESFRHGPVGYGVVPEPTALDIEDGKFTMGLRLWRIEGKGWWRDYTVLGDVAVRKAGIALTPQQVVEGERSPGAVVADPLAALGEGVILDTLEDAFAITLPAAQTAAVGDVRTSVTLVQIEPSGPAGVLATGRLEVIAGGGGKRKPRR